MLGLAGPLGTALAGAVGAAVREVCAAGPEGGFGGGAALTGTGDPQSGTAGGGGWAGPGIGMPVLLVPVPSARRAVRARGHDPTRRIALAAAGELRRAGMPARVVAVLRQRRGVADQAGLNSRQRLDNLAGALTVVPGGGRLLAEGLVVLVDDLMTTGASLTEAARVVREARVGALGEERAGVLRGERVRPVRAEGVRAVREAGVRERWESEGGQDREVRRREDREVGGLGEDRRGRAGEEQAVSARGDIGCRAEHPAVRGRDDRQEGGDRSGRAPLRGGARQERRRPGEAGEHTRGRRELDGRHGELRQDASGRRGGPPVAGSGDRPPALVYTAASREGMGERMIAVTEEGARRKRRSMTTSGAGGVRDVVCAAVVAAPPDSFEINRN
ncbi:hypothetical protein M2164_005143 [Streptomyces sp. SAI-208]|nr:hypothetical protein [Streptomyces sp. SAI-208]